MSDQFQPVDPSFTEDSWIFLESKAETDAAAGDFALRELLSFSDFLDSSMRDCFFNGRHALSVAEAAQAQAEKIYAQQVTLMAVLRRFVPTAAPSEAQ